MTYAFGYTTLADLAVNTITVLANNAAEFAKNDKPLETLTAAYVPGNCTNPDSVTIDYADTTPEEARLRVAIIGGSIKIQTAVDDGDYIDDCGEWATTIVVDDDDEDTWEQIQTPEAVQYDTADNRDEAAWHAALRKAAIPFILRRLEETLPQAIIETFCD